jgi:hypothetical protein
LPVGADHYLKFNSSKFIVVCIRRRKTMPRLRIAVSNKVALFLCASILFNSFVSTAYPSEPIRRVAAPKNSSETVSARVENFGALAMQAQTDSIRRYSLATNDLMYDANSGLLYASVPSSAGSIGNSITPITPTTGALGASVYVGSEPGKLALSDDGISLYVALNGSAAVRRFDTRTQTPDLQFTLGTGRYDGSRYFVNDMSVMPGARGTIAISRRYQGSSPSFAGVAVYDDGVQRPTTTPDHTGSDFIEFSSSASTLLGISYSSYNNYYKMSVTGAEFKTPATSGVPAAATFAMTADASMLRAVM